MTKEHVHRYADAIVRIYTPSGIDRINHDIRHKVLNRKVEELKHMILAFTDDVDIAEKERIANNAVDKLKEAYTHELH